MIGVAVEAPHRRLPVAARALLAVAGAAVLLGATAAPLGAVNPIRVGEGVRSIGNGTTLGPNNPVLTFQHTLVNPTPLPLVSDPEPQVCTPRTFCDEWALAVGGGGAPFMVSLRNAATGFDANDGFNLAVYAPDGHRVGTSSGIGSNGQAVAVGADPGRGVVTTRPAPGVYHVVVTLTYAYDNPVTYLGEARLLTGTSWTPVSCATASPCDLLPRLTPLPPSDIHIDGLPPVPSTPLGFPFPVAAPTKNSCYADEKVQTGAKRCLRFTTEVQNTGGGMLELRWDFADGSGGVPTSGVLPGGCEATQVVYRSDGTSTTRDAGPCEFHPQHAHFHYRDLVAFSLRPVVFGGLGAPVAQSVKESFCLADDDFFGYGSAGPDSGPRDHPGMPGCDLPSRTDAAGPTVDGVMGVSPGWGDVYSWDTPGQFLDITSVRAGEYAIVEQANPDGRLLLDGAASVCSATLVRLTASTATMLTQEPSITCP